MKKLFSIISLLVATTQLFAQAPPQAFTYSGIARSNGQPIVVQPIGLELSIIEGTPTGTNVYTETQNTTTDSAGYFSVAVGYGTATNGTFSSINWGNGNHYLQVSIDTTGGTNYTDLGTTQLLSVPYALFSGSATNVPYERIPYDYHINSIDTSYSVYCASYDSSSGTYTCSSYDTTGTYITPSDTTVTNLSNYAEITTFRNGQILLTFSGYAQQYSFQITPSGSSLTFTPLFQTGIWSDYNGAYSHNITWSATGSFSNGKIMLSQIIIDTDGTHNEGSATGHGVSHETFSNFLNQ